MNSINSEKIDEKLQQYEAENHSSSSSGNGAADDESFNFNKAGQSFDLSEIVYELEQIGNTYLEDMHKELRFSDDKVKLHSDMLAFVLGKNLSLERLKQTPEYLLTAQTILMGTSFYRKMKKLEEQGEI